MAGIRIEAGCTNLGNDSWAYRLTNNENPGSITFVFTSDTVPQMGDTIEDGVLVKKTGYIINDDPGFQKRRLTKKKTW